MKRLTYEEAFEVMEKFHRIMEETGRELFSSENAYPLGHFTARLFFMIEHCKATSIKDLKNWLNEKHGNVDKNEKVLLEVKIAKATGELIGFGLIALEPSKEDKRVKNLIITEKGRDYLNHFKSLAKAKWEASKE